MVSVIQNHFDPWHPNLLNKSEAQLDAILAAYADTFPDKFKFDRSKEGADRKRVQELSVQWSDKLIGGAKDDLRKKVSFRIPEHARVTRPPIVNRPDKPGRS